MTYSAPPRRHPLAPPGEAFPFGRNWQRYLSKYLNPERERIAQTTLENLVGTLRDKTFLDIGCGSGLFSLSAYRAGARQVISLDVDQDAVSATHHLRANAGFPSNWQVRHVSILDSLALTEVPPADVVYSWGVLHHTGDMYFALRNAAELVAPGGVLAIAIYNRVTRRFLNSVRWHAIKWSYNRAPRLVQRGLEGLYAAYWVAGRLTHGRNPVTEARTYRANRGMALWTDLVDWLGGYPYEFATQAEIVEFCERTCALRCVETRCVGPTDLGNNEYVFTRLA